MMNCLQSPPNNGNTHVSGSCKSKKRKSVMPNIKIIGKINIPIDQSTRPKVGNCFYCERKFSKENPKTIEHLIPLSKGGDNSIGNLKDCCKSCNQLRGNLSFIEFSKKVELYKSYLTNKYNYTLDDLDKILSNLDGL